MTIRFRGKHKSGFWVDVPIHPFDFPAGEAHFKLGLDKTIFSPAVALNVDDYTILVADVRGHDPQDLFHLALWANVLDEEDFRGRTVAFLPYIPAARADRGLPAGAKVYADFISNLKIDKIISLDPHSSVAPEFYDNMTVYPFERLIRHSIQSGEDELREPTYAGVIAPDNGAVDRASHAARVMGVPMYRAAKVRDFETGRLSGFHLEDELPEHGKLLIVDDICDGGGTFVGLAAATGLRRDRLDLWVTHGVFSKGFDYLRDYFGTIHTTDSFFGTIKSAVEAARERDGLVKVHSIDPYFYAEASNA